jgi:lipopolysaccharide transport system permease protein
MTAPAGTLQRPHFRHPAESGARDLVVTETPLFVVEPCRGWRSLQLKKIWEYRELLFFLSWRDMKVRYKQTALGALWGVIPPLMTMVVFTIFFGKLGGLPSDGIPYWLFSYAALLPWQLFASCLGTSARSVAREEPLLTKVYFPRLIVPLSTVPVALVDFSLSLSLLLGIMAYHGLYPKAAALACLPLFLLLAVLTALAFGIWLAALNVRYRDVQHALPFLTQFWLFITPIAYPATLVPAGWRWLYSLNPMVGVVEGFRWALLPQAQPPDARLLISVVVVAIVLAGAVVYFRRSEAFFADWV